MIIIVHVVFVAVGTAFGVILILVLSFYNWGDAWCNG